MIMVRKWSLCSIGFMLRHKLKLQRAGSICFTRTIAAQKTLQARGAGQEQEQ